MGGSRKRSRNAVGVRIGTGSTRPVELMAGGRPVGRIFERDGVKVSPQCRMQVSVILLVIPGVRRREYHVAGKAAGAKGGGEPKTTLGNMAILDGLSGFRRGWLYERDPAVRPFNIVGMIAQYGTRLNDLLGEMPASVRKSQRRKIDSAGDAIVGGQRLHAVQDCGEAMCGFLERVTSSRAIRRVCDRHGTARRVARCPTGVWGLPVRTGLLNRLQAFSAPGAFALASMPAQWSSRRSNGSSVSSSMPSASILP